MFLVRSQIPAPLFPVISSIQMTEVPLLPDHSATFTTLDNHVVSRSVIEKRMIAKKGKLPCGGMASLQERQEHALTAIQALIQPRFLLEIEEKIKAFCKQINGPKTTIHIPHLVNANQKRTNILADVLTTVVMNYLKKTFADNTAIDIGESPAITLLDRYAENGERLQRTNAGLFERLTNQRQVIVPPLSEHGAYFIVDDHIQSGGMSLCLLNKMIQNGSRVAGIAALSIIPESSSLQISPNLRKAFDNVFTQDSVTNLSTSLARLGLDLSTLTNREAATVFAYMTDGVTFPDFEKICRRDNISLDIAEATGETLRQQHSMKAMSMDEFDSLIGAAVPRHNTRAASRPILINALA